MGWAVVCWLAVSLSVEAQINVGAGSVRRLYQQHCAQCHGENLEGGRGSSLLVPRLAYGEDDASMTRIIREGLPGDTMPGYLSVLSGPEIRSLVIFIREMRQQALQAVSGPAPSGVWETARQRFTLSTVLETEGEIWALAFLPGGELIFTQKEGRLWILPRGGTAQPVEGLPEVWHFSQGGLMDLALHPEYPAKGWIYLSYSARVTRPPGDRARGMTVLARGRIEEGRWVDHEVLWEASPEFQTDRGVHFGSRVVLAGGYAFFSIGDRGDPPTAQDLSKPMGKIHRIHDDGRVPADNPWAGREGVWPTIWSIGHRNPQGLDWHPVTGDLWSSEHGPRGGDELNRIRAGRNYGWPRVKHGMNYDGSPITAVTERPGMEPPVRQWTPSIAVCGIHFYRGEAFPEWRHDLFVTGLASQQLHRVRISGGEVVEEEIILQGEGRLRAVVTGPDGALYLAANLTGREAGRSRILRLHPVPTPAARTAAHDRP